MGDPWVLEVVGRWISEGGFWIWNKDVNMKYNLRVGERTLAVEFSASEGTARAVIEGKEYRIDYESGGANCVRLAVQGDELDAFVVPMTSFEKQVSVRGRPFLVRDSDREPRRRGEGGPSALGDVTPPMPSVVTQVLVEEGDEVTRGQGLVVVSAMKMETTLRAPTGGRVRKVATAVGLKVGPGDILVEIDERE